MPISKIKCMHCGYENSIFHNFCATPVARALEKPCPNCGREYSAKLKKKIMGS